MNSPENLLQQMENDLTIHVWGTQLISLKEPVFFELQESFTNKNVALCTEDDGLTCYEQGYPWP